MIYKNVALHNVAEVDELENGAFKLQRFPKNVRAAFEAETNKYIAVVGEMTTACEIRFVADKPVEITLLGGQDGTVEIWRGEFFYRMVWLNEGQKKTIPLENIEMLEKCNPPTKGVFSSQVWRVRSGHDTLLSVLEIKTEGSLRAPTAEELPQKKIIAYGSSITHSAGSVLFHNSYLGTIGRELGVDVLCKGMGGSCFCHKEVAEYLPTEDWDLALLELGVNMVETFPVEVFKERASEVVRQALTKGKPVVMISMFMYFSEYDPVRKAKDAAYNKAYKEIFEEQKCDNLYYIDGKEILNEWTYLTFDLIHPSPTGHLEMGRKIADKIRNEFKLM